MYYLVSSNIIERTTAMGSCSCLKQQYNMHLILAIKDKNDMTNISFLVVIVGSLYAAVYSMSHIQYVQPNGFSSNSAFSGSLLWSSNVTSTIRCSQLCQNDDRCISFNTKKLSYKPTKM